jgi:CRP-like cAMP-binding protein
MDPERLASIPLFMELTPDQRQRIAGVCEKTDVAAGDMVLREGDFGYSMFAITSGTADVLRDGAVLATLGPGDVFGEIAVLSSGRRVASVVATSPMELVTILNRDLWRLERDVPEVASALREKVEQRVAELERARPPRV